MNQTLNPVRSQRLVMSRPCIKENPVYDFELDGRFSAEVIDRCLGIGLGALLKKGKVVYE